MVHRPYLYSIIGVVLFFLFGAAFVDLPTRYRLADQVPDREQALDATSRIDQKLTGANPVHVMIEWNDGTPLYSPKTLEVIGQGAQRAGEGGRPRQRVVGRKPRRWLHEAGDDRIETVQKFVGFLPEHLVRRFIAEESNAVLVTGRLPDVDSSHILPVVEKIDRSLDPIRAANPSFQISVTGLPAVAARNSARMIDQLKESIPICVAFAGMLLGLAFRSPFVAVVSLLPGLFPVLASGALLWAQGAGLEFASVVALLVVFGLGIDALIHFLNRLRLEEREGRRARARHPPRARAGGTGHHPDDDRAGLRPGRDGLLRPAVAADVRPRLRLHAAGLAARRPRVPAGDDHGRAAPVAAQARRSGLERRLGRHAAGRWPARARRSGR